MGDKDPRLPFIFLTKGRARAGESTAAGCAYVAVVVVVDVDVDVDVVTLFVVRRMERKLPFFRTLPFPPSPINVKVRAAPRVAEERRERQRRMWRGKKRNVLTDPDISGARKEEENGARQTRREAS